MANETQAEVEERLKEERALEIMNSLRDGYKKLFKEDLTDEEALHQLDIKIAESKTKYIQHMLHNLCGTVLEPEDLFRAKKMLNAKTPISIPEPIKTPQSPVSDSSGKPLQQEESIVRQRGRPRAK